MKKGWILPALLLLLQSACLQDESFKLTNGETEPVLLDDGWDISSPEAEDMDLELLEKAYDLVYSDERFLMARSLLVIRNGKLVAEAYPHHAEDRDKISNIQSCTKSITSVLVGSAIQQGLVTSLDEKLYEVYPEFFDADEQKRQLTVRQALRMQTGLVFDNDVHTQELYQAERSSVGFVLSQTKEYAPGLVMKYNDGAPHLISKFIERKADKPLATFAAKSLFDPLKIKDWKWESAKDGTTFGAFSLFLKPRDFGKIGQLLLQNGKWNGQSLVDSTYLAEATAAQVSANFNGESYGYYFWTFPANNSYAAVGHGGQFLLIVPDKALVVVYTAWPYTNEAFFDQKNELMDLLINSCR